MRSTFGKILKLTFLQTNAVPITGTVPYTHIDRSSEQTAMPDFAEDAVNDLLELLLTLPNNSIFPFHDNSLISTPNFEFP
jgi:hypothetical protein